MSCLFERLAILGPGLLGGSLALAARQRRLATEVSIYGRRESSLAGAREAQVADRYTTDPAEAVEGADLVVLCVPIGIMADLLQTALPKLRPKAIVTDVGSVKGPVVAKLEPLLAGHARWVGSHPMAGSHQTGFHAADPDLFCGAVAVVTPTEHSDADAVRSVETFWTQVGCRLLRCSPQRHDELVAAISHLPHVAASALVNVSDAESRSLAGGGFRDTTRVAAGPTPMWTEILQTNHAAIVPAIDALIEELSEARQALVDNDTEALADWLEDARETRADLPLPPKPQSKNES